MAQLVDALRQLEGCLQQTFQPGCVAAVAETVPFLLFIQTVREDEREHGAKGFSISDTRGLDGSVIQQSVEREGDHTNTGMLLTLVDTRLLQVDVHEVPGRHVLVLLDHVVHEALLGRSVHVLYLEKEFPLLRRQLIVVCCVCDDAEQFRCQSIDSEVQSYVDVVPEFPHHDRLTTIDVLAQRMEDDQLLIGTGSQVFHGWHGEA